MREYLFYIFTFIAFWMWAKNDQNPGWEEKMYNVVNCILYDVSFEKREGNANLLHRGKNEIND